MFTNNSQSKIVYYLSNGVYNAEIEISAIHKYDEMV